MSTKAEILLVLGQILEELREIRQAVSPKTIDAVSTDPVGPEMFRCENCGGNWMDPGHGCGQTG